MKNKTTIYYSKKIPHIIYFEDKNKNLDGIATYFDDNETSSIHLMIPFRKNVEHGASINFKDI